MLEKSNKLSKAIPKKAKRIFMSMMGLTYRNFEPPEKKVLIPIGVFNIFGCDKSTDIDIVMVVPRREDVKQTPDMKDLRMKL